MRKSAREIQQNRGEGALRGWVTRKANDARRARKFDEVVAENRRLKAALRDLLAEIEELRVVSPPSKAEQAAADLVRS